MTSERRRSQPPGLAACFVDLFCPAIQAESILGDLSEEFSDLAASSGVAHARRWYWRQSVRTIAHLAGSAFRVAPRWLGAALLAGFLLSWFGAGLPEQFIVVLLRTQRPYSNRHYEAYMWLLTYGVSIARVLESLLIGALVAVLAKGREMVGTLTLTFLHGVSIIWVVFLIYPRAQQPPAPHALFPLNLFWSAVNLIGIAVAGVLVRKGRSIRSSPPAADSSTVL